MKLEIYLCFLVGGLWGVPLGYWFGSRPRRTQAQIRIDEFIWAAKQRQADREK